MGRKTIQQLSPAVINKIAAGEVIERPASVVKELVENAIDAGATHISVTIKEGGAELIRVVDNGHGIPASELPLAVASHATSKIRDADDLFCVHSMGFRGEALASIAEVSEFLLRSRVAGEDAGAQLEVLGGQLGQVEPCGSNLGTTIEVRRLFFNTPVRRKFMRTAQTEMSHATEAITRIALAHPHVHFVLHNGRRETLSLPPVEDLRERIASCFGRELAEDLIPVESRDECANLHGYVASPQQHRSNTKHQYLFLNGRHIRDRALQHALAEAYRGILLTGRHPVAFLHLEMAPEAVDVNVHPTKLEVRFQDGGRLYKLLLGTLRDRFLQTDLTATVGDSSARPELRVDEGQPYAAAPAPFKPFPASPSDRVEEVRRWARGEQTPSSDASPSSLQQVLPLTTETTYPSESALPSEAVAEDTPVGTGKGLQVHNRYLVAAHEDGIIIIDQHALHERVLYEQLREQVLQHEVEVQRLLVPEPVQLTPTEAAHVLGGQDELAKIGVEVSDFGGNVVLVSSYPAMLRHFDAAELIRQLAEQLGQQPKVPEARDLIDEILHMMSCKAAIKAGDPLSGAEIDALIDMRHLVQDAHHCPHGRPTTLVFTQRELDRRFQRT